jgi:putative drug exporter of the RND superfamily
MARRPRLVWAVTAVVLGALAFGLTGLKAEGLQNKDAFRTKPESVTGEAVLARHFAAGAGDPVQVIGRAEARGRSSPPLPAAPG